METYIPGDVYNNLAKLLTYRNVKLSADPLDKDTLSQKLNHYEYVTLSGDRAGDDPRGPAHVIVFLIAPNSKYSSRSLDFKKLLRGLPKKDHLEIIFVSEHKLTVHIAKALLAYKQVNPTVYVEDYDYTVFMIETPKHNDVPPHRLATDEEIEAFCVKHYTSKDRFPKIHTSDPMAVWLGARPGMCVHVTRLSETAGEAVAYRFCVKG